MVAQDSFCSLNSSNGILFDFFIACFSWESVMCISVKQGKPMFIHSFIHSFIPETQDSAKPISVPQHKSVLVK